MTRQPVQTYIPGAEAAYGETVHRSDAQEMKSARGLTNYGSPLRRGMIILLVLALSVGAWAVTTKIQGAVIVNGTFIVEGKPKSVQHLNGGIIRSIAVKNGDVVAKGDLLMSLEDTIVSATLQKLNQLSFINQAQIARLEAERNQSERIVWPTIIQKNRHTTEARAVIADQEQLFWTRKELHKSQTRELNASLSQIASEITGIGSTLSANDLQLTSLKSERQRLVILLNQRAISKQRVDRLDRDIIQLSGEIKTLKARIQQLNEASSETQSKLNQLDRDKERSILEELGRLQSTYLEYQEQFVGAQDKEFRAEIRSPAAGVVHNLKFTTANGVIPSGQELMQIIPLTENNNNLIIEAKIMPKDIDQVQKNQKAVIALSAYHRTKAPQLDAEVVEVSADLLSDAQTGQTYYNALVRVNPSEMSKLNSFKIIPGMPADCFIQTEKTSVLRYLFKPIENAISASFREE